MSEHRRIIKEYWKEKGFIDIEGDSDWQLTVLASLILEIRELKAVKSKPKITKGPKSTKVWAAYESAYWDVYKIKPQRNAMNNKLCCGMMDRIGEQNAIDVINFYLESRDSFYTRNAHGLRYCAHDCEVLLTKMKTGLSLTSKQAKKVETAAHNATITRRYLQDKRGGKNGV